MVAEPDSSLEEGQDEIMFALLICVDAKNKKQKNRMNICLKSNVFQFYKCDRMSVIDNEPEQFNIFSPLS